MFKKYDAQKYVIYIQYYFSIVKPNKKAEIDSINFYWISNIEVA